MEQILWIIGAIIFAAISVIGWIWFTKGQFPTTDDKELPFMMATIGGIIALACVAGATVW